MRPCHFFPRREGVLGIGHLVVFLFRRCITYCNKCKLCSKLHWQRYKWSVILMDLLGPRYFLLRSKRQLFYTLRWLIYVFNSVYPLRWLIYVLHSVVNTKLPAILSHRRSTTVSFETYPFIHLSFIYSIVFCIERTWINVCNESTSTCIETTLYRNDHEPPKWQTQATRWRKKLSSTSRTSKH